MNSIIKKILIIVFFLFLASCSEKKPVIERSSNIVALGDSLTFGYGGNGTTYPQELQKIIEIKVINEGISGDTSKDVLDRLPSVMDNKPISLVILAIGGNDMLRGSNDIEITSNINQIIDYFKSLNIEVVLLAEPRPSSAGLIVGLNDAKFYKKIAQEKNILLIEEAFSNPLSKKELKSDLIHLNSQGYREVANKVAYFLKKSGYIKK